MYKPGVSNYIVDVVFKFKKYILKMHNNARVYK